MQKLFNTKGRELTCIERCQIERWHNVDKMSNRQIALLLGKSAQTINNELKLGQIKLKRKKKYSAQNAQELHEVNKSRCGRRTKLTEKLNEEISMLVKEKYSLEVICSMLNEKLSLRTLYHWLKQGWLIVKYHELLYPHYKKVQKLHKTQPVHPYGLSIEERPENVNKRLEAGHYEIDTVLLTKTKGECLLTLTERKYRTEIIRLIKDKSAQSVNLALLEIQKEFHIKSLTADNGREFARLSNVVECPIYYCHAYASFERGTNENHNRMIRRHLPKGTKKTTKAFVAYIENWINNYPRRMFEYKSSNQMLYTG